MFEDALFASNRPRSPRQNAAAMLSFCLQGLAVVLMVVLPMFFTEALPLEFVRSIIAVPLPPAGPPPSAQQAHRPPAASNLEDGHLVDISEIPKGPPKPIVDQEPPPQISTGPFVPGATGPGGGNSAIDSMLNELARNKPTVEPPPPTRPVIVSHIDEGLLIRSVKPVYPQVAILARVSGAVVLRAVIGRDGAIRQLQVVSGPPLLVGAAVDAVRQWRYRPYILNGQPVEVETEITVNFKLGSG